MGFQYHQSIQSRLLEILAYYGASLPDCLLIKAMRVSKNRQFLRYPPSIPDEVNTISLSKHRFDNLEQLADGVRHWDVEFRPLASDTSGTDLTSVAVPVGLLVPGKTYHCHSVPLLRSACFSGSPHQCSSGYEPLPRVPLHIDHPQ